jgi:hypothetical protein
MSQNLPSKPNQKYSKLVKRGRAFEYKVRDLLLEKIVKDYSITNPDEDIYFTRSAGSHSVGDLVFIFKKNPNDAYPQVWIVQCSLLPKAKSEVARLIDKCSKVGAIPVVAYKHNSEVKILVGENNIKSTLLS